MERTARHGSLRAQVYQQLLEDIILGRYKRGTALTESQLTRDLGVSRTPVREAISQLIFEGLVQATPNKSIVVQGFDEGDMMDLYEVRRIIESLAAGRAAEQMTPDQIQALEQVLEKEKAATEKHTRIEELQVLDNAFHEQIYQGSGSMIFQNILSSINQYTRQARMISIASPGRGEKVISEHARILEAVISHDAKTASQAMRDHINSASANFMAVSKGGKDR